MKPNIVIIMSDQQQAALRRGEGYALDTMPNLDLFCKEGVDFANAYTTNPACAPARCSMLTGRYTSSHRVRTNHNLRDALYTADLIDLLKQEGYTTALCGKNHTYRHPDLCFDFHAESDHLGAEKGKDKEPDSDIMREFRQFMGNTRFIDWQEPSPFPLECQMPYRNVSSALRFLDTRPKDRPFFLWLSFAEPHNPYQVPKPYFDLFPLEALPVPASWGIDPSVKGERFTWLKNVWDRVLGDDLKRIERMRSNYHGMLRLIDDQLGRFLNGIRERSLNESTIIIYLSDHGDFAGKYGMMRKGGDLCEALTRIPMIWKVPGMRPVGRLEGKFVSIADIFPTLCDLLDLPIPFGVQGKSILPLLKGQTNSLPRDFDTAYCESGYGGLYFNELDPLTPEKEGATDGAYSRFDCLNTWTQSGTLRMLRMENFKIQLDMTGKGYLYDLKNDPEEIFDLWSDPKYSDIKAKMLTELAAAQMRFCDPLPSPHFRYRVKRHPKNYFFANDGAAYEYFFDSKMQTLSSKKEDEK